MFLLCRAELAQFVRRTFVCLIGRVALGLVCYLFGCCTLTHGHHDLLCSGLILFCFQVARFERQRGRSHQVFQNVVMFVRKRCVGRAALLGLQEAEPCIVQSLHDVVLVKEVNWRFNNALNVFERSLSPRNILVLRRLQVRRLFHISLFVVSTIFLFFNHFNQQQSLHLFIIFVAADLTAISLPDVNLLTVFSSRNNLLDFELLLVRALVDSDQFAVNDKIVVKNRSVSFLRWTARCVLIDNFDGRFSS